MSLLVVGSVAFDTIETPYGKRERTIGGASTYIGLAASYFTREVRLLSVVGGDFPAEALEGLRQRGINTDGIQIIREGKSFYWSGRYGHDLNTRETLATELNVLAGFDPVLPDGWKGCDVLMLGNLTPSVQRRVIEQLRPAPALIVMDTMNFWMNKAWSDLLKTLSRVHLLMVNDEEARQLSGEYSLVKAAKKILAMGPRHLIVKKGEHGALLFDRKEEPFFAPALPLEEVFDPTGAGDTFAGGFTGYLLKTRDFAYPNLKKGLIHGAAMASFCVERFGTEGLLNLSGKEIARRVSELNALVKV